MFYGCLVGFQNRFLVDSIHAIVIRFHIKFSLGLNRISVTISNRLCCTIDSNMHNINRLDFGWALYLEDYLSDYDLHMGCYGTI